MSYDVVQGGRVANTCVVGHEDSCVNLRRAFITTTEDEFRVDPEQSPPDFSTKLNEVGRSGQNATWRRAVHSMPQLDILSQDFP